MTLFRILHTEILRTCQLLTTVDADVADSATEDQTALSQVMIQVKKKKRQKQQQQKKPSTRQKSNMQRKSTLTDKQMD